jgi:hypothetical protein
MILVLGGVQLGCGDSGKETEPAGCVTDEDCMGDGGLSVCRADAGVCVECLENTDCRDNPNGRVCDVEAQVCVPADGCLVDADCAGDPDGVVCDEVSGECVECLESADCGDATGRPVCDPVAHACVECLTHVHCEPFDARPLCGPQHACIASQGCVSDADCATEPGRHHCEVDSGACVECLDHEHCVGEEVVRICDPDTFSCRQETMDCTALADCSENLIRVYCDETAGRCSECLEPADCADSVRGDICDTERGLCVACVESTDCADSTETPLCDTTLGRCVECRSSDDCVLDPDGQYCDEAAGLCVDCVPLTCEGQEKICGVFADGCSGEIACGTCGAVGDCIDEGMDCDCPPDTIEPNDSYVDASHLGLFTDEPATAVTLAGLSIDSDDDEDWFVFDVSDDGWLGNPRIVVHAYLKSIDDPAAWNLGSDISDYELTVWYACDSGGDNRNCGGNGEAGTDVTHGLSCVHVGSFVQNPWVEVATKCAGIDESGVAVIRVRKTTRYGRCDSYDLDIDVH